MARKQARTQVTVEICVLACFFLEHKSYYPQDTNNYHKKNGKNYACFSIVLYIITIILLMN